MSETALSVATSTDSEAIAQAVANGQEARTEEPKFELEKLDGSSVVSVEHPRSERTMLLERLKQHESDLEALTSPEADSEQVTSNESTEAEPGEQEPEDIDIAAVRKAATEDAIAAARRQQQERDEYYRAQQTQHFSNPQAEIETLRAELMPPFQEKFQALIADVDAQQLQQTLRIPLSEKLLDGLLCLPGGVESAAWLARNPQELQKLSRLPEHMGLVHVAQLANRMNPAAHRRPSNAPEPIRPISGSATRFQKPADEMTYQEYRTFRDKQEKTRYRR